MKDRFPALLKPLLLSAWLLGNGQAQPLSDSEGWKSTPGASCKGATGKMRVQLPSSGSMLERTLPIKDLRGWRIQLEWTVIPQGEGSAALTIRAGDTARTQAFLPNCTQRMTVDIPHAAKEVRLFLHGREVAFDLPLLELKKLQKLKPPQMESARPLTERELTNLVAFGKLYGYVRHFYPDPQDDWDRACVHGVRAVSACQNDEQLSETLREHFAPLAPFLKINGRAAQALPAQSQEWKYWRHHGFAPEPREPYWSRLESASQLAWFHSVLRPGLTIDMPLTLPAQKEQHPTLELEEFVVADRATRLAAVLQAWTLLDHFYPYFEAVHLDWSQALAPALEAAAQDTHAQAFAVTLLRLLSRLQDGHVRLTGEGGSKGGYQCFGWCWVGDQLVATNIGPSAPAALRPGSVITHVQDKVSSELLTENLLLVSGSPQYARLQATERMLNGKVKLQLDCGQQVEVTYANEPIYAERRPEPICQLRPGIIYADVTRTSWIEFEKALPRLQEAAGIVIDCRGYPNFHEFLPYFSRGPMQSAEWLLPDRVAPDHTWQWDRSGRWNLPPRQPYLGGKVVFLTDANAISFAESCMAIVEQYRLGPIVGQATAGCNGNINRASLVGGYTFSYTAMKVLRHDGLEHMLRGVRPTHPVERTLEGIRSGRDEVLDKALELLAQ